MAIPTSAELLQLETRYWQAIQGKDAAAASRLTSDPSILAGASGVMRVDPEGIAREMQGASYVLHDFAIEDGQALALSDDAALFAYKVREELTVDGKPVTVRAADTSVWVRRADGWVCALHTESLLGDAYGRDRLASGDA